MPEYTRQWFYTSEDSEADHQIPPGAKTNKFAELMLQAHDYAKQITDPRRINWVQVTFIWY